MKHGYTHATTWANVENIMLSEKSQTQKTTSCFMSRQGNPEREKIDWWLTVAASSWGGAGSGC